MPLRALVLSGGGAKGAFQVGALDTLLNEQGLEFAIIAGVSTGALSAGLLAQGAGGPGQRAELEGVKELYFSITSNRDVQRTRFLGLLGAFLFHDSIFDPAPLRNELFQRIDPARLRASGTALRVGAVCLEDGRYRAVTQDDPHIREFIFASASMPVFWPPEEIDGRHWVDGGVRNVTPLRDAIQALHALRQRSPTAPDDPDEMWVVLASPLDTPPESGGLGTALPILKRTIEILEGEIYRGDFAGYLARHRGPARTPPLRLRVILPTEVFSGALEFDPAKIRRAYESGRERARVPLDEAALGRIIARDGAP
ncbi:MAG TPA: patatin-like phospholipase family protein [Gemmatimonadales bacterium]